MSLNPKQAKAPLVYEATLAAMHAGVDYIWQASLRHGEMRGSADLLERMQGRAHTALLVLFALPNALPSIPGTSAVTGVPLLYLSLQLALGRK
ncbi:MAG: exopolysaccharide biosynthesis protein, partial [Gemmobacter sp.]